MSGQRGHFQQVNEPQSQAQPGYATPKKLIMESDTKYRIIGLRNTCSRRASQRNSKGKMNFTSTDPLIGFKDARLSLRAESMLITTPPDIKRCFTDP
jgi:hypothetical protein